MTLSSAEIGQHGEATFVLLCTQYGWVASRPSYDKFGWDFLVELGGAENWKVLVQVKSQYATRPRKVRINLEHARRFADEPYPAFYALMVFDEDDKLQRIYLKHFDIALIEDTRTKFVRKKRPKTLGITFEEADHIRDLREGFDKFLRGRRADYAVLKRRISCQEKGHVDLPIKFAVTLKEDARPQDLSLALLSLVSKIPIESLKFDRSNLPFPDLVPRDFQEGEISLSVPPTDRCELIFRTSRGTITMPGEVYVAPPLYLGGPGSLRFGNSFLSIIVLDHEEIHLAWSVNSESKIPMEDMKRVLWLGRLKEDAPVKISIRASGKPTIELSGQMRHPWTTKFSSFYYDVIDACEELGVLFPMEGFSAEDLHRAGRQLAALKQVGDAKTISLRSREGKDFELPKVDNLVLFELFDIMGVKQSVAFRTELRSVQVTDELIINGGKPSCIQTLEEEADDYDDCRMSDHLRTALADEDCIIFAGPFRNTLLKDG